MHDKLVPTARVDKNGRTVTRHMRVESGVSKKTKAIPVPSVTVEESTAYPEALIESIGSSFTALSTSDNFRRYLLEIHAHDPSVLPVAATFLSTGSEIAHKLTKKMIWETIKDMIANDYVDNDGVRIPNFRRWSDLYQLTQARLASAWSLGNVIAESGMAVEPELTLKATVEYAYYLEGHTRHDKLPGDTAYWRGVAALTLTDIVNGSKNSYISEFIEWAGNHDDIGSVMTTMIDRKTIRVEVLRGVMEQTEITSPLSRGIL